MENTIDVSIIIVNYNTSHLINPCIESIFEYTKDIEYEIIIVDNYTEELNKTILRINDLRIKTIQLSENLGFGKANNKGVEIANGRNVFFLNPDTIILNNAIKILSDFLDNNNRCGICGGNLVDESLKPSLSYRKLFPGIKWEINELLHLIPEKILYRNTRAYNKTKEPVRASYITGADLMIRKSLFRQIGGFCDKFFMYYEETDLCFRVHKLKYEIFAVPSAKIQHLEGKSFSSTQSLYKIKLIEESRRIFYINNKSKLSTRVSNLIYSFFLYVGGTFHLKEERREYYKVRKSVLKEVWKKH